MKNEFNEEDEDGGAFTTYEIRCIRRILRDDAYARRFKTTVKVWTITIGTVASVAAAGATIWRELLARVLK